MFSVGGNFFSKGMCFKVGKWVRVGPICCLCPRWFTVVFNKCLKRDLCLGWGKGVMGSWCWGVLCKSELEEFDSLSCLLSNIFIYRDEGNTCIWQPDPSRTFF